VAETKLFWKFVAMAVEQAIKRVKAYRALGNLSISELKLASLNFQNAAIATNFQNSFVSATDPFLLGTIWSRNKRTLIKLFQSELWRCDDGSILTTQPLVSLIYSAFVWKNILCIGFGFDTAFQRKF
jgi:hypothetical protein